MAILGTMPVITAPKPLYKPSGVSRFTISLPVVKNPRAFVYAASQARAKVRMISSLHQVPFSFLTTASVLLLCLKHFLSQYPRQHHTFPIPRG